MHNKKNPTKILIIHGPSLNMLGQREPGIYGKTTLAEINDDLIRLGKKIGLKVDTFQSNHEGKIVDTIQQSMGAYQGLIINPAAYTHTSIAIRDALLLLDIPIIEVHISNIHKRETFRQTSLIADVVTAQLIGFGVRGYRMGLEAIAAMISAESSRGCGH